MSTGQDPGTVPSAPPADAPPSYDASEQSKNPDGPPGPAVQPGAPPQVPYVTNVPFAGGYPMMMPQQPGGQQPVQYVIAAPSMYPTAAVFPKPEYPGPHSFMAYAIVVAVICGFLNIFSLFFTVPALVCAAMSMYKTTVYVGQFQAAKKLGAAAFILSTISLVVSLGMWLVIIGSLTGIVGDVGPCNYIYYSRYSNRYICQRYYGFY